jgi:cytochrome P450 family 26 subfamily A
MKTLKQVLDERREKAETPERMDFIDVIVSELNKQNPALSENLALNVLFLMIFASFETTSSGLTAALKFLSDNPKALQELEEEHQQIRERRADPDTGVTWEEYKSMKFTSHVINESLRLANVAPVLFRKATQDVHIKGYTIPEGWIVMICPPAVHLNPTTYEDPSVFNPWRWKDLSEPVGGSKDFIAFGSGLRLCVGVDFARLQMAILLHFLVTKYRLKVVSGGDMVFGPGLGFPNGFQVQLERKK